MTLATFALLLFAADPAKLSQQALEAAQRRDLPEAERLWKQALALSPDLFEANFNLGYMYRSKGDLAAAEEHLRKAAVTQPQNYNAQYLFGAVLSQLNRTEEAIHHWRIALRLHPDDLRLMQVLAIEYSKGRYFRNAADLAEQALTIKQDDPSVWLTAIKARQDANEHSAALQLAQKMTAAFPDHPRAAFELGYELTRAGRGEEGLPWLVKAMNSAPRWEEPFYFYGDLMLKAGEFEKATQAFEKAIQLRRNYMPAWAGLARALMSAGKLKRAQDVLLEAATVDETHPQPHLLLSQVCFRLGDEERARKEKELAARLRQGRPEALESIPGRTYRPATER